MDPSPDILKASIQALKTYYKNNGKWPSAKEWNRYAFANGYYSAYTLQYLDVWESIRLGKRINILPPRERHKYKLNRKNYEYSQCGNLWANQNETNLRKARKAKGLTIQQLSDQAGLSKKKLSEVEMRISKINAQEIEALAMVLEANVDDIKEGLLMGYNKSLMYANKKD